MAQIQIIRGDITKQTVDAVVNAANESLLGGGGVDGAIHRAAGPRLLEECRTLGGCRTGEAKITKGHELPAKFVIHTVGPVYGGEQSRESELLANCYRNSMQVAHDHQLKTLAFPSISTGVFGYPISEACRIALRTVKEILDSGSTTVEHVTFVTFSQSDYEEYRQAYAELFS